MATQNVEMTKSKKTSLSIKQMSIKNDGVSLKNHADLLHRFVNSASLFVTFVSWATLNIDIKILNWLDSPYDNGLSITWNEIILQSILI